MADLIYNVYMPQYRCPKCHQLFEWPNNTCPHCGLRINLAVNKAKPLYCSDCGAELYEGKTFCPSCGSDQSIKESVQLPAVEVKQTSDNRGYAPLILGLIASNISWFTLQLFFIFGFMAIGTFILGMIATIMGAIQCRRSSNAKTGMILGIVAMVISTIALLMFAGVVVAVVMLLKKVL